MAVDEALLPRIGEDFQPFLRWYTWSPGCLSLGRFQNPQSGLKTGALEQVPVVRRSTGGGAIWHHQELTYSLAFRVGDLETTGVKETYERLCWFLLSEWQRRGWDAGFAKDGGATLAQPLGTVTAACFAGKEPYDILVRGRKLGGNAQRRDRDLVFQHGSIPLALDWRIMERVFLPEALPDAQQVTDLKSLGWEGSSESLVGALSASFEKALGVQLQPCELDDGVAAKAERLMSTRYLNPDWTYGANGSLRSQET